jgi:predicted MFS family arabinose efflux permease
MTLALKLVLALSVGQVIGWATAFYAIALLARPIAADLGLSLPVVLAGTSLFLATLALTSRGLAPVFDRFGAGPLLAAGSGLGAVGFGIIALSAGIVSYAAGWIVLGVAGAGMLTAPANALLVQVLGPDAKRRIAGMMLITGLAGSIGLPVTAAVLEHLDWRGTLWLFAALHLVICAPLHLWASGQAGPPARPETPSHGPTPPAERALFRRLALSVSLIGFVTWGFAIVVVELLQASGLSQPQSVAAAALIGVATVGARAGEFLLARNLPASRTAIWATAALCLSLGLLAIGTPLAAWGFVILFGAASGSMSVARATLPLELFAPATYAGMAARLALPMNLAFAAAPPVFGLILERAGARAALAVALCLGLLALTALVTLRRAAQQKGRAIPARPPVPRGS